MSSEFQIWQYTGRERPPFAEPPGAGQRSVWDYPRPPVVESDERPVAVRYQGLVIAESTHALKVLETASAPGFYLPTGDIQMTWLRPTRRRSVCEWKGAAHYFDLVTPDGTVRDVGWCYPRPHAAFAAIAGYLSFYPSRIECCVDGEQVGSQPGGFYGGWVTADIAGPIKGAPGTGWW
ncbi:MAG: DUF427 domain-containing protein [Gammaproteobacteria bacterium]|jgi:uncharacterized protein (DUF427 family)